MSVSAQAPFIYLASQSPRRLELLTQWGVRCETLLPSPDEDAEALEAVLPGDSPRRYVQRVTRLKLQASLARLARRGLPLAPVLCADTTVALGRQILGKPDSPEHAAQMGREGRQMAEQRFSLPAMMAAYEGVYDRVLKRNRES